MCLQTSAMTIVVGRPPRRRRRGPAPPLPVMGAPWVGAPCAARAAALRTRVALASLISCGLYGDTIRGGQRAPIKIMSLRSARAVLPPAHAGVVKGDPFPPPTDIVSTGGSPVGVADHRGEGPPPRPPGAPCWRCATRSNLVALGRAAAGGHRSVIPHQRRRDALAYAAVRRVGVAPPRTGPGWGQPPNHVPTALCAVCGSAASWFAVCEDSMTSPCVYTWRIRRSAVACV